MTSPLTFSLGRFHNLYFAALYNTVSDKKSAGQKKRDFLLAENKGLKKYFIQNFSTKELQCPLIKRFRG